MAHRRRKRNPIWMIVVVILVIALASGKLHLPREIQRFLNLNAPKEVQQLKNEVYKKTTPPPEKSDSWDNIQIVDNGPAKFTNEELQNDGTGWIQYGELDHLGRATTANAVLTKALENDGTGADPNIRPTGFISGLEPYNHSRGHLIGRQLGGRGDDPRNLATLYQQPVNTPYMTKYENMVRAAVRRGDIVRYRVTPIFEGDDLLPKSVHMEGKSLTKWGRINFDVTIPNEQ